jgi:endonuclease/exonuclease/phosphatase family metal-dependent hydrolase
MIVHLKVFARNFGFLFSRSQWAIRLLGLSKLKKPASQSGLVMIQIDGLSLTQLQRALQKGHMPFLNSLLQKERYALHTFYSGLPSNTPSVQGELFYGVKTCVPAFNFVDRQSGNAVKMFDTPYVAAVEEKLKEQGEGLLSGGSSYSNIFTGGATESHFCFAKMGWSGILHAVNPLVFPFLIVLYIDIFIRTIILFVIELFLAVVECIKGTLRGKSLQKELEFIWLRAIVCVLLREFIAAGVCIDLMRGLPIIHFNLLGYDEQSHCRGPSSRFAHWSLQGIDDVIKRIYQTIPRSPNREYDLWVYSDHGQERTTGYQLKHGVTLEEAVKKVFDTQAVKSHVGDENNMALAARSQRFSHDEKKRTFDPVHGPIPADVVVTAMGPLGHIYVNRILSVDEKAFFAQKLVTDVGIPLVLIRDGFDKVVAYTASVQCVLPANLAAVFGPEHPFLEEMKEDLMRICDHPDAGDFIILGWCQGSEAISFPSETGAHAGAGTEETKAFALLPLDVYLEPNGKNFIRPEDLRKAAQNFMTQKVFFRSSSAVVKSPVEKKLRLMSYNVHGCRGMDGKLSTDRIARVISRYNPDVIALQELDAYRKRSAGVAQAEKIARHLGMFFQFHSTYHGKDEQYGRAILSRYPMALIKQELLPNFSNKKVFEPRGVIWVVVDVLGTKINVFNTHLSLLGPVQVLQCKAILGADWLSHVDCQGPVVLCGDFNMTPGSPGYRKICTRLRDSQAHHKGKDHFQTWYSAHPFRRIDYAFITEDLRVKSVPVDHTALEKIASDHLPLIVDLELGK